MNDIQRIRNAWADHIEHMLNRPLLYTANLKSFEIAFHTALQAWDVMNGSSALTFCWEHVLREACAHKNVRYIAGMSTFWEKKTVVGDLDDPDGLTYWLRRVWDRMRNPIDRLAAIGDSEG